MEKRIYFKDTEPSELMEKYANEKLVKIEEFLKNEPSPVYINLTFAPSKVHAHNKVELQVISPHYDLFNSYEYPGTEFYDVLDRVIDVMYRRLLEEKAKRIDNIRRGEPKLD